MTIGDAVVFFNSSNFNDFIKAGSYTIGNLSNFTNAPSGLGNWGQLLVTRGTNTDTIKQIYYDYNSIYHSERQGSGIGTSSPSWGNWELCNSVANQTYYWSATQVVSYGNSFLTKIESNLPGGVYLVIASSDANFSDKATMLVEFASSGVSGIIYPYGRCQTRSSLDSGGGCNIITIITVTNPGNNYFSLSSYGYSQYTYTQRFYVYAIKLHT